MVGPYSGVLQGEGLPGAATCVQNRQQGWAGLYAPIIGRLPGSHDCYGQPVWHSGVLQGERLPGAAARVLHGQQGHARLDEQLGPLAPCYLHLLPKEIHIACCLHLHTMRFECTFNVLAKHMLTFYRIS